METITLSLDEYRRMAREIIASVLYFADTFGDLDEYKALVDEVDEADVEFVVALAKESNHVR